MLSPCTVIYIPSKINKYQTFMLHEFFFSFRESILTNTYLQDMGVNTLKYQSMGSMWMINHFFKDIKALSLQKTVKKLWWVQNCSTN